MIVHIVIKWGWADDLVAKVLANVSTRCELILLAFMLKARQNFVCP